MMKYLDGDLKNMISNDTNTAIHLHWLFPEPLKIIETGVNDIKVTINDDMSSFLRLGARLIGRYRLLS
jgi:hypothetical protein